MRNLKSSSNIDYSQLEELLRTKKYFDANALTIQIILFLSNRQQERWLDVDSIKFIPCEDLKRIDSLWVEHTDGKYGFSIRRKDIFNFNNEQSYGYFPTFRNLWGHFLPRQILDEFMKLILFFPPVALLLLGYFYIYVKFASIYFIVGYCVWTFLHWMYKINCKRWREVFLSRVDECNI
jgi:hypothetical protein